MYKISFIRTNRLTKCLIGAILIMCFCLVTQFDTSETINITHKEEIRKFAFMKVHQSASSTVENILFRFAFKSYLNIASISNDYSLSKENLFDHHSIDGTEWIKHPVDIVSLRGRWNRNEVMIVLGQQVPAFTIVRHPVDVFVSMFYNLEGLRSFYGVQDIHEMINMIQFTPFLPVLGQRWSNNFGRNQLAWDLGLSADIFDDLTAVERKIERLDREFDLVMISERMDESLVLLRELFNWPLDRVFHLDLKTRKQETRSFPLSHDERVVLAEWLHADVQIYNHFSKRFDQRVLELNAKQTVPWYRGGLFSQSYVQTETQVFKDANLQLYDRCVIREVGNEKLKGDFKWSNNNWMGYVINRNHKECSLLSISEATYLKIFNRRLLIKSFFSNGSSLGSNVESNVK